MQSYDKEKLLRGIDSPGIKVEILDSTSSTNDYFQDLHGDLPYLCIAEYQTSGRGRMQRKWESPKGQNIHMSLFYRFYRYTEQLSGLSLTTGLALREAIEKCCGLKGVSLKWPNDVLYEGRKLAGILIENRHVGDDFYAVIGIGVNVNMKYSDMDIETPWTSIYESTKKEHDRNNLVIEIVNNLIKYFDKLDHRGFSQFAEEWESHDVLQGKYIRLRQGDKIFEGPCVGVDEGGRLSLRTVSGLRSFNYGEVTTR